MQKPVCSGKDAGPVMSQPNLHPAPLWDLRLGDCVEGMRALADASVDVVVTSPPYNLDIDYGTFEDNAARGDYLEWCDSWANQIRRVLKPEGSFFLNIGASPKNPLLPHQLALRLEPLFRLQNTIHWIKSITVQTRQGEQVSAGHFKPINSRRFLTDCHEYVFHFTHRGDVPLDRLAVGVPYAHKSNIGRWSHTGGQDRRCRGNNWFIPYQTIRSREAQRPHPATFPAALAEQCLKLHGLREDMTVLDPFLGIGHSAIAAATCGAARFIGFELDPVYHAEACERVAALSAPTCGADPGLFD